MKEKIIRVLAILGSLLFLAASVGIVLWMGANERGRLAERERLAREMEAAAMRQENQATETANLSPAEEAKKVLHDVDTLLSGLGQSDIPSEAE